VSIDAFEFSCSIIIREIAWLMKTIPKQMIFLGVKDPVFLVVLITDYHARTGQEQEREGKNGLLRIAD